MLGQVRLGYVRLGQVRLSQVRSGLLFGLVYFSRVGSTFRCRFTFQWFTQTIEGLMILRILLVYSGLFGLLGLSFRVVLYTPDIKYIFSYPCSAIAEAMEAMMRLLKYQKPIQATLQAAAVCYGETFNNRRRRQIERSNSSLP